MTTGCVDSGVPDFATDTSATPGADPALRAAERSLCVGLHAAHSCKLFVVVVSMAARVVLIMLGTTLAQAPVRPAQGDEARAVASASPDTAESEAAALARDLLVQDPRADDLAWLYSNAVYSPSDITGEPVPVPAVPGAGEGTPREWDPRWRKFSVGNYLLTGFSLAGALATNLIAPVPDRWQRRNSVDEWGRSHLGYSNYDAGGWARDVSDVLWAFNTAFPLLVDSLLVSYWYRASPEVAQELALITVEAISVTALVQGATAGFASRERPYGRDCGDTISNDLRHCVSDRRYRSYFSGHTSGAFAGAAVTCSHHIQHELFGDPVADGVTCGLALTSAATVGMMRIAGRQHYITDVVTGAALGTLGGLALPWLLHYRVGDSRAAALNMSLIPSTNGLSVRGVF